jgi:hypothetical protein
MVLSKTTCEIDDKNQTKKQFISSQPFHPTPDVCVRETTAGEQFEPQNFESFDPITQELYQLLPVIIHPLQHNTILEAQHNLRTQAATGTKFDLLSLKTTTKIFLCGRTEEVTSVAAHRNQLKTHKNDSRKRS